MPQPNRRRRNDAAIEQQSLPAEGRPGDPPPLPDGYVLSANGEAWWQWAWRLPQATRWDDGALYFVARRAQLEDDLATLDEADGFDVADIIESFDEDFAGEVKLRQHVETLIRSLRALAGKRTTVMKEMRELDNRLGLNPKALLDLRWTISEAAPAPSSKQAATMTVKELKEELRRRGVAFSARARKAQLVALLEPQSDEEATVTSIDAYRSRLE